MGGDPFCTHVKIRKLLQICRQVVTRLLSSRYQDVFTLLVPSCCDKSVTSCYHLVTRLLAVTDLLQVVATRLIQAIRNKLLQACCHQLVNHLLHADDIRLVRITYCESVGILLRVNWLSISFYPFFQSFQSVWYLLTVFSNFLLSL